MSNVEWTTNNDQTESATYIIGSGNLDVSFTFTKSDVLCDTGIEIYLHDGTSYIQHDLSILTTVNSMTTRPFDITASGGATETVSIRIETTDGSLDSDGTITMPVLDFKILISSPDIVSNPSGTNNPVELFLSISMRNPCRDAKFDVEVVPDIT